MDTSFLQSEKPLSGQRAGSPSNFSLDYSFPVSQIQKNDGVKLLVLLLLWGAVFAPLYPGLVKEWLQHSDNSHAFLVPLISLYLLWQKKEAFKSAALKSSMWGGALFFFSMLAYGLSYGGGLAFPARIAMVSSLFGLLWFCLGNACTKLFAFPVVFLLFMIPVPYSIMSLISMRLQLFVTTVSADLISSCSIPVYREGNMLYFTQTQLEVADACSGIRSLMSLTMLGLLLSYLSRPGWCRKTLLVAAAIPIAMLANIVRVAGTGILAHFYGDKVAKGFMHDLSGLLIFFFGFVLLFGLYYLVNRRRENNAQ